jgi:micrococcal nuclease
MACSTASRPTDRPSSGGRRRHGPPSVILLLTLAGAAALAASGAVAQPVPCGGAIIATGEVIRVIDGRGFIFADGREVRLAAIEAPPLAVADPNEDHVAVGDVAKAALEGLLAHHSVVLKSADAGPDRYGRLIGHVFITGGSEEIWAQYEILTKGYALVGPGGGNRACLSYLRGVERKARAAMLGLWGDPYYLMKEAQYPDDVMTELGRFALVGGKVISVRESGGMLYLNFGRRWTEDFSVAILKRNQRAFVAAGVDPKNLAGRYVEVRGWIEQRGGPAIEAVRPEQIEIVGGN